MYKPEEAQQIRIKESLGARVNGVFFDEKAKVHRINVTIFQAGDHGRAETHNYYVHTENEVSAQELAVALATGNFLGTSGGTVIKATTPTGNSAQQQEKSSGSSKETSKKDGEKTGKGKNQSQGKGPSGQASVGGGNASSTSSELLDKSADEEELEEVESPYKKPADEVEQEDEPVEEVKPAKGKAPKVTAYDRSESHVDILSNFLTAIVGNDSWQENPGVTQFSISLVGKPFIDDKGEVVESFQTICKDFFKVKGKKRAL